VVRVVGEVGAGEVGEHRPWWRERMVSIGGFVVVPFVLEDAERVPRRGWRARNATKGYVVTWEFLGG
jgi:hypothetical protein